MNLNHRRQLIIAATLGPALGPVLMPAIALAQPTARPRRIGYLSLSKAGSPTAQTSWAMILDSLRRAGWQAGANLLIERRNAEGEVSRLDALAAELVGLNVELIIASLNAPIAAAKRATGTVPIVMLGANLPVELGFVQSLARPGGNVTGTAAPDPQTAMKAIEVLKEIAPGRRRLALLFNPSTPGVQALNAARGRAAQMLGMTVQTFAVTRADEITAALEQIAASRAEMLFVAYDGVTESRLSDITAFAIQHKMLAIGPQTLFTSAGGAIYYGSNLAEIVDRTMSYVDRILRGAKPAELPVEQPTRFDLIINLQTMRALGITVPAAVLARANEVIE